LCAQLTRDLFAIAKFLLINDDSFKKIVIWDLLESFDDVIGISLFEVQCICCVA